MQLAFAQGLPAPLSHRHSVSIDRRPRRSPVLHPSQRARPAVLHRVNASLPTPSPILSPAAFDAQIASDTLSLCFVGMSNCGKSHWSSQLATGRSFSLLSVDEEIEAAIEPELRALGFSGIDGMAEWMGFPTDDRFAANQARYLHYEEEISRRAVDVAPGNGNFVLDTTGSVIYLSPETRAAIRGRYLVVHLEASDDMLDEMTDNYFLTPKPVVWGDCFERRDGEEPEEALRRCYPRLLKERRKRYAELAHVAVPAKFALDREVDLDSFLKRLRDALTVAADSDQRPVGA